MYCFFLFSQKIDGAGNSTYNLSVGNLHRHIVYAKMASVVPTMDQAFRAMVLRLKETALVKDPKKSKEDMTEAEKKQAAAKKEEQLYNAGKLFMQTEVLEGALERIKARYGGTAMTAYLVKFPFKACFNVDSNGSVVVYKDFESRKGYVHSIFQAIAESYKDELGLKCVKLKDWAKDLVDQLIKDINTTYESNLEWDFFQTKEGCVISVNWHTPEKRAQFQKIKEQKRREYASRQTADSQNVGELSKDAFPETLTPVSPQPPQSPWGDEN